jgi:hypothetical protein
MVTNRLKIRIAVLNKSEIKMIWSFNAHKRMHNLMISHRRTNIQAKKTSRMARFVDVGCRLTFVNRMITIVNCQMNNSKLKKMLIQ